MGRHRAARRHPVAKQRLPDLNRLPRDRQRATLQKSHRLPMAHASERFSADAFGSILF